MQRLSVPRASHLVKVVLLAGTTVLLARRLSDKRRGGTDRDTASARKPAQIGALRPADVALRESQDRFRRLTEHSPVGVYQLAPDRGVIYLNPAARAMIEVSADETIPAVAFERFFTSETLETMKREHPKRQHGIASTYEVEIIGARGGRRSVLVSGAPLFDANGALQSLIGTMTDVTEHAAAERALRENQRFLATLISNLPGYAYRRTADAAQTLEFVSDGIVPLTGYHVEDFLQDRTVTLRDLMHQDDREPFERHVVEALGSRRAWDVTFRLRTRSGEERWVHEQGRGVHDRSGTLQSIEGFVTDITDEKHIQDDLRESERRLRTIIEHAPEAMVILDVDEGRFIDVNENAVVLFGYPREDLLRLTADALNPPDQPDGEASWRAAEVHIADAVAGRSPVFEWTYRNEQGQDILCEVRLIRLPSAEQTLVRGSITDIRERKRVEEQLLQAQKMDSIGRLAGGIAHDFNNLMTAAIGYSDLALTSLQGHEAAADVREIRETAERAASLSQQLLAFSRRQVIEPRVISLNDLIARTARILHRLIGDDVELITVPAAGLGLVRVDPNHFEQVLINLAVNARDAMPGGGKITMETANVELEQEYADAAPGPYVMLAVSDDGTGMSAEVRAHIFEPFYTTKPKGKGTGLGLATCYGVVKQAGGDIWVYSEPGHGSTFKIYLPRVNMSDAAGVDDFAVPGASEPPRGTETVLLVEDDRSVRAVASRVLRDRGYTVLEAPNGEEALAVAASCSSPIDLLLTDVVMPRMGGKALAERLATERPGLAVLYMSGYTEDAAVRHGVVEGEIAYLQKPFSPLNLARAVRETLDAASEGGSSVARAEDGEPDSP